MRSFREILFRVTQEAANAWMAVARPKLPASAVPVQCAAPLPPRPEVAALLRGSVYARDVSRIAESICQHRFPLLGRVIETGNEIRWRRDYVAGIESPPAYFRRIPYLDSARAGDHKIIWELNRHQHLVLLAQAWLLTANVAYLAEVEQQLESWWEQNPFQHGINWASALEVAFRALSWVWLSHLCGDGLGAKVRNRLHTELYRHGLHLERNLSVYFSPNTHLLGEAVVLHLLGVAFPAWPRASAWRALGGRVVREEMGNQVRPDGSHFEQSSAYHVYATDFFLLHSLFAPVDAEYRATLRRMADYLAALSAEDGTNPLLGDDDGGNIFHPFGERRRFGGRCLAAVCVALGENAWPCDPADIGPQAAWWFGTKAFEPRPDTLATTSTSLFRDAGLAVLSRAPVHIAVDTRAFGAANAGHSHAHALHVVCRSRGRDVLIDPGTYTYVAEPEWRERFRGTAFHNTVRVDGLDQATQAGPFRWLDKPVTAIRQWVTGEGFAHLHATCTARGIVHERQMLWLERPGILAIVDTIRASEIDSAPHLIEQFWHAGGAVRQTGASVWSIGDAAALSLPTGAAAQIVTGGELGWQSDAPGTKEERSVVLVERRAALPVTLAALLTPNDPKGSVFSVEVSESGTRIAEERGRFIAFSGGTPTFCWE